MIWRIFKYYFHSKVLYKVVMDIFGYVLYMPFYFGYVYDIWIYMATYQIQYRTRCKINLTFQSQKPSNLKVVLKMVLNTTCYQYLWMKMWFHAKQSKETLKKPKSLILPYKFGSRAQKWLKNAKQKDDSITIYSIFCIGMVYIFRCLLVNPYVQAVQNIGGKGG